MNGANAAKKENAVTTDTVADAIPLDTARVDHTTGKATVTGWGRWVNVVGLEAAFTWATLIFMAAGWGVGKLAPQLGWAR